MDPVNEADLDWEAGDRGDPPFRRKRLAAAAGGEEIGCSLYELPAGARSWPYHYHAGNEEAIYVLAGTGTLRTPEDTVPLDAGDYVAFPTGEDGGHRVVNDGEEPIRYLAISTMNDPDVTVYPDSEKFGVYVGAPPGDRGERSLAGYYRVDDDVDYWEDEEP